MVLAKCPPLTFSMAEMSVAEMSGPKRPRPKCPRPKCPTFDLRYQKVFSKGFGAQLIGPIQLHVKRQNSSICKFFQDIAWTFFLPVSGKICHSPIKKVKRQPTLIISFSQHSPFFEEQSKNPG